MESGLVFQIMVALVIILATYFFLGKKNTKKRGSTVFLIGETGAGKTSLLYLVLYFLSRFVTKEFNKPFLPCKLTKAHWMKKPLLLISQAMAI
jgi:ABC-type transport system involved in cytochrome bd biosynthesis fused ATPase/permease subunit